MDLKLLTGAFLIWLSVIGFAMCYLGVRDPRKPKWAGEFLMANIIVPAIVGGLAMGIIFIIDYFVVHLTELKILDLLTASLIVASSYALVKMMRIDKRVAEYEKQGGSFTDRFRSPDSATTGTQAV